MRIKNILTCVIVLTLLVLSLTSCGGGAEKFVGEWVCLDDLSASAVIEKTDNGYVWIDEDGRYPARYKDGMLRVDVGLGEAQAYYDKDSKEMVVGYMGDRYRFIPKSVFLIQVSSLIKKYRDGRKETWVDRDPDRLKQYVTDFYYQRILRELEANDFIDTITINYTMEIGEIGLYSDSTVHVTTKQNWNYRFKTNDGSIIPLNGKDEIEINQEFECVYFVVRENGEWKIDDVEDRWMHRRYLDNSGNWVEY